MRGQRLLKLAGWLSAAIAVLHVIIVFVGPPAYRYFGAGEEMARRAEAGSLFPAALTLAVAMVFVLFALYAFAGAGTIRRLPLLRTGLVTIGAIYTLRGLSLFPQLASYLREPPVIASRDLAFSLVSLIIGLFYLAGTIRAWSGLRPPEPRP